MRKFIVLSSVLLASLLLISCSVNTNLGGFAKKKINTAIRSSVVKAYSRDEIWQLSTTNLGLVETEFCQTDKFGSMPTTSNLRKVLKSKTLQLGGNGIVYDSCQSGRNYMNCEIYIRCRAIAYSVKH